MENQTPVRSHHPAGRLQAGRVQVRRSPARAPWGRTARRGGVQGRRERLTLGAASVVGQSPWEPRLPEVGPQSTSGTPSASVMESGVAFLEQCIRVQGPGTRVARRTCPGLGLRLAGVRSTLHRSLAGAGRASAGQLPSSVSHIGLHLYSRPSARSADARVEGGCTLSSCAEHSCELERGLLCCLPPLTRGAVVSAQGVCKGSRPHSLWTISRQSVL